MTANASEDSPQPTRTGPPPASRSERTAAWLRLWLTEPLDGSLLAFVRISFGGVVAWELLRLLTSGQPAARYIDPPLNFTYWPFDWVTPLPAYWLNVLFLLLAVLALLVEVGLFARTSAALLGLGMTYIFLLERTEYLNHWYLACILAFMLAITPCASNLSVDAWLSRRSRPRRIPGWSLQVFRFQLSVVYIYGGLAKIDPAWIAGRPLTAWLSGNSAPLIGPLLANDAVGVILANLSLVFDLSIAPAMWWHRTRRFVFPLAITFHLLNSRLFNIGMFPWMMLLLTAVYFPADMPRRMWSDLREGRHLVATLAGALVVGSLSLVWPSEPGIVTGLIGAVVGAIAAYHLVAGDQKEPIPGSQSVDATLRGANGTNGLAEAAEPAEPVHSGRPDGHRTALSRPLRWFLIAWVTLSLLIPFRHLAMPGNASWTGEGHLFAWRMLMRSTDGSVRFLVTNPATGRSTFVDPARIIEGDQLRELPTTPDMLVQFAHWLEDHLGDELGPGDLKVFADTQVSLNGSDPAPFVDPGTDLTSVDRPWIPPADWIEPAPPQN